MVLRSNNNHFNLFLQAKLADSIKISDRQRNILTALGGAPITRRYKKFAAFVALCELPCKRMLAATGA